MKSEEGEYMKTALLLVDIQNDYFPNGKMELRNPVEASEYASELLKHFRMNGGPIFHIQHVAIKNDATFSYLIQKVSIFTRMSVRLEKKLLYSNIIQIASEKLIF